MIISTGAEKVSDNIQYPFMIKTLSKVGIETNSLNLIKNIYKTPIANMIINGEKLDAFPPKIRNKKSMSLLTTPL